MLALRGTTRTGRRSWRGTDNLDDMDVTKVLDASGATGWHARESTLPNWFAYSISLGKAVVPTYARGNVEAYST